MSESVNTEIQQQSLPGEVDWDDFRVFVEVVKIGSFNRAAGHLNMTQPTVSRRLARLEEVIGCKLFDRDRRGPRLTPEGQRIYTEARAAQSALIRAATTALRETRAIPIVFTQVTDPVAQGMVDSLVRFFRCASPVPVTCVQPRSSVTSFFNAFRCANPASVT